MPNQGHKRRNTPLRWMIWAFMGASFMGAAIWSGFMTKAGREKTICKAYNDTFERITAGGDKKKLEQLARILPLADLDASPLPGWTFAAVGDYVIPLPPERVSGTWRYQELEAQTESDAPILHFLSSKQHLIMFRPYPPAGIPAMGSLLSELLFKRPLSVSEFSRLTYERDLSHHCDPSKPMFEILADALLMTVKGSSLNASDFEGVRLILPDGLTFIHRGKKGALAERARPETVTITTEFRFKGHWLQLAYLVPSNLNLASAILKQIPLVLGRKKLLLQTPIPFDNQNTLEDKAQAIGL